MFILFLHNEKDNALTTRLSLRSDNNSNDLFNFQVDLRYQSIRDEEINIKIQVTAFLIADVCVKIEREKMTKVTNPYSEFAYYRGLTD